MNKVIKAALCCTLAALMATSSMVLGSALDGAEENELEVQTQTETETEQPTIAESEETQAEETQTETQTEAVSDGKYTLGDVTFDGNVNLLDAIAVQKFSLSMSDFTDIQKQCGDVDRNGAVNLLDSIMLQKYTLGILDEESEIGKYFTPSSPTDPTAPTQPQTEPTEPVTTPTDPTVPTEPVTTPTEPTGPTEPDTVELDKTLLTIGIGEKYTLVKSSPTGSDLSDAVFTSNNPDIVTVDASTGEITGLKVGGATVKITTHNGATASCSIAVKKAPTTMTLNKTSLTLGVGETYDLNSSLGTGEGAYSIIYTSNNSTSASVKAAGGLVTAENPGTAVITATAYNGVKATCTVTVKEVPTAVYLNKTCVAVAVGGTYDLNSSFKNGEGAYSVKYSVKDSSIAMVKEAGGLVTGVKPGVTTVTATTYNGKKVECTIAVASSLNVATVKGSSIMSEAKWASKTLKNFSAGAKLNQISKSGNWYMVEYNGTIGYVYNRAFNNQSNYLTISESTLPVVIDDWLFVNGKDIQTIYNFAKSMGYRSMSEGSSIESMCVHILKFRYGACYQRASILYYMLNRAGYEVKYVKGVDYYTGGGPHRWCMIKMSYGWRHIDPTPVIGLPNFYLVKDSAISPYFGWDRSIYPAAK
ncbi:MAG: Ig-like domain-containing protein [Acutalibacteraceae bacterium]